VDYYISFWLWAAAREDARAVRTARGLNGCGGRKPSVNPDRQVKSEEVTISRGL
jgi:hypothetical protein